MILEKCFKKDWILKQKQSIAVSDPSMLEKAIFALALLGHLAESALPFVFKGGTSLLLHLSPIRRLSIDIDIVCAAPAAELDALLARIAVMPPFNRYEESKRGERGLPRRRHFKFFYDSPINGGREFFILLDVVEESQRAVDVIQKAIRTPFIEVEREVMVNVPTIEGLLGDKLTAFAPHTTGVPFEPDNGKPCDTMQVVKQMFDVAELFGVAGDLSTVSRAYDAMQALEAGYRGHAFTREQTLLDTRDACLSLTRHNLKGVPENPDAKKLLDGAQRLSGHLVRARFNLDDAKVAAGKVALLSTLLLKDRTDIKLAALRYNHDAGAAELKAKQIAGEWERLNRLQGPNPEAFFYWHKAWEVQNLSA